MNRFIFLTRKGVRWLFRGGVLALIAYVLSMFRFGFWGGIWSIKGLIACYVLFPAYFLTACIDCKFDNRCITEGRFLSPNAALQSVRRLDEVARRKGSVGDGGFIKQYRSWYDDYEVPPILYRAYELVEDDNIVVDLNVRDVKLGVRYPEIKEPFSEETYKIFDPYQYIDASAQTIEQAHIIALRPVPLYRWFGRTYTIVMIDAAMAKKYGMSSNVLFVEGASKARIYRAYDRVSGVTCPWAWRFAGFFCQLFVSYYFWALVLVYLWIWRRVVFCRRRRESTARLKRVGEVFQKFRKEHGRYPVSFEEAGLGDSPDRLDAVNKKPFILVERYDWGVRRKRVLSEHAREATSKRPRFEENKDRFLVMSARKYRFLAPLFGTVCALALLDDGSVRVLRNFLRVERMYDKLSYDRARAKKDAAKSLGT